MTKNKKKSLLSTIQNWMESVPGQIFLNYAYSWGAAIVILGTLFKLTHIPGANAMLFIGMGTEVFVFFLAGFDRPASSASKKKAEEALIEEETVPEVVDNNADVVMVSQNEGMSDTMQSLGAGQVSGASQSVNNAAQPLPNVAPMPNAVPVWDMNAFAEVLKASNEEFLEAAKKSCNPEMEEAAEAYITELRRLTETLSRVSDQAENMTRDSKEMENLNRTLTGINTIYEMQLKSISKQVGTIDDINEQTRRMASQIEELNAVYGRMIKALTVNMKNASGNVSAE